MVEREGGERVGGFFKGGRREDEREREGRERGRERGEGGGGEKKRGRKIGRKKDRGERDGDKCVDRYRHGVVLYTHQPSRTAVDWRAAQCDHGGH